MAVDYSLVITWSYFTLYVLTFFIVSIVCAREVRKQYKESRSTTQVSPDQSIMSKKSAFMHWAKLLWKKKSCYIQLIPHFFDQATDFGVIYEYWTLRNDTDISVNTMYLFGVSVGIIILHRIISSVAIYRLTKKWKYAILQLIDALMTQCIYTNYILDNDEPSNAQRYLQVLEATFVVKYFTIFEFKLIGASQRLSYCCQCIYINRT